MPKPNDDRPDEFEDLVESPQTGIIREFWDFLRYNKKWWLTPIVLVLLLVGVLGHCRGAVYLHVVLKSLRERGGTGVDRRNRPPVRQTPSANELCCPTCRAG